MDKREVALKLSLSLIGSGGTTSVSSLTPASVVGKFAASLYNTIYCNLCLQEDCPVCCSTCNESKTAFYSQTRDIDSIDDYKEIEYNQEAEASILRDLQQNLRD